MHAVRRVIAPATITAVRTRDFPAGVFDNGVLAFVGAYGYASGPALNQELPRHGWVAKRHRDLLPSVLRPKLRCGQRHEPHADQESSSHVIASFPTPTRRVFAHPNRC